MGKRPDLSGPIGEEDDRADAFHIDQILLMTTKEPGPLLEDLERDLGVKGPLGGKDLDTGDTCRHIFHILKADQAHPLSDHAGDAIDRIHHNEEADHSLIRKHTQVFPR